MVRWSSDYQYAPLHITHDGSAIAKTETIPCMPAYISRDYSLKGGILMAEAVANRWLALNGERLMIRLFEALIPHQLSRVLRRDFRDKLDSARAGLSTARCCVNTAQLQHR